MPPTPFPFDPVMTGVTLAYPQRRLIADFVLPRLIPINIEKFKYKLWTKEESFTLPDTKVGRKGEPTEVEFTGTEVTGVTKDYGLDDPIPMLDIINGLAEGRDPKNRAVVGLTNLILLGREQRVANLVFDATKYAAGNKVQLAGVNQWTDKANSTPLDDILAGLDAAFVRPNTMTIGREAWTALITHPTIVTATGAADKSAGIVRMAQIAELFELDQINVGEGRVNTAARGQPAVYARVWGKHCLLHWNDENVASSEDDFVTFGFTVTRALANGVDRVAGSIPAPKKGLEGSEIVRVGESLEEVIAAADVAYYIEDAAA